MDLKTLKKEKFNKEGIFFTSNSLAEYLRDELLRYSKEEIKEVFDITCGNGALLKVFDDDVIKYGAELNIDFLEQCFSIPNFIGEQCNLLKTEAFKNKLFKYQVFNYPFSVKDKEVNKIIFDDEEFIIKTNKDTYFLLSVLNKMEDNGIAVGLAFPGIAYRIQEKEVRKALILNGYLREIELIENDHYFVDTSISVLKMIFVKSENKNKNVVFRYKNKVKEVSIEEIEKQDFNLSVHTYIEEEIKQAQKTLSMQETIDMNMEYIKKTIKYVFFILEADYIVGDSNESEYKSYKKLFLHVLNELIKNINEEHNIKNENIKQTMLV